jgi:valyl-tRNA synthetase
MEAAGYDHLSEEAAAREIWESADVYKYVPGDGADFSVDTPPAYVSADHLHVGHAMSYSQPDFIVRYRRMRGERVFYPMGFDDNGLPTERYVEQALGVRAAAMPRAEFVALCLAETRRVGAVYEELWRRLGLSVDWSLRYSTIDERCQRTAQASFIKLFEAGAIRRAADPVLWCPLDRTALAQADIEDSQRTGVLHRITFTAPDGRRCEIATTRPELLPACVALYHHPSDARYDGLRSVTVPLSRHEVPVLTDSDVDPSYGTGLMMVCTFGDGEDVQRWRRDKLDLRIAVRPDGRLGELAGQFAGLTLTEARKAVLAALAEAGLLAGSSQVKHVVGVHERCWTPAEFQIRPQWFIALREHATRYRDRADELEFIPDFMRRRLEDWIGGLKWDWNISRQRRYGVPFPVWFCSSCSSPVLASLDDLPVDPLSSAPPSPCRACGSTSVTPDPDVMDTWMTSSLTPQINRGWHAAPGPARGDDYPEPPGAPAAPLMSVRVQGFEIIRTWLFYTLVQSELHDGRLPWRTAMIAGWGLNEQGRKLSKRDLSGASRYAPEHVIETYGADALRLWAAKARSGTDLRYTEKDVRAGRKLVVKLWNVARFMSINLDQPGRPVPGASPVQRRPMVDRWLLAHLAAAVAEATAAFEAYDYAAAYAAVSRFFWPVFCDRYLEMIKDRLDADALSTVREAFRVLLGLFAPFAPFVTESLYQRFYAADEGAASLHVTPWPSAQPSWAGDTAPGDQLAVLVDATRALRSQHRLGSGARLAAVVLQAHTDAARELVAALADPLRVAARADAVEYGDAGHPSGLDGITVTIRPASGPSPA